jgi:hypothetical protein
VIEILTAQLKQCPSDFFEDLISCDNFIRHGLLALANNTLDRGDRLHPKLQKGLQSLWRVVQDRFDWDVLSECRETEQEMEEGEYAPVVVED